MNVVILPEADAEAIAAALWYETRQSRLGSEFFVELQSGYKWLETHSDSLPLVDGY